MSEVRADMVDSSVEDSLLQMGCAAEAGSGMKLLEADAGRGEA